MHLYITRKLNEIVPEIGRCCWRRCMSSVIEGIRHQFLPSITSGDRRDYMLHDVLSVPVV